MKKRGFTLVEIMIVVAIIALLTAIAIPAFLQYRKDARRGLCVNNLRLIDHAKEVLAIKLDWTNGQIIGQSAGANDATAWSNLDPYIDGTHVLECLEAGAGQATVQYYYVNRVDETPTCPVVGSFPEHVYID
ncbi:MAG: prepilin-type N-terminal cleavage/methylation domain-containing protein [Verrucomicrobiota bacterium]|nr:prepilin-type N-terminal cleavage/methylation domain-containing protein [Verrucomicrobiota bacterium]